ncbi:DUF4089 domain-containing protein [Sphingomonas aliaeris]|uniref:DUF4089 domain-containing protein n=1 Tax=Sphingomonas aliaeris TaxID=2759526 RepID=A0A974NSN5_9SPHN|nr:AtzG-like protein [Sphingomonas aliaeris]QQV76217.1 DUF4089 domain-containing protein [Sphingomonas aliaeris]
MQPPLSDIEIETIAKALIGLDIPAECLPGVSGNLAVLLEHARRIAADVE